MKKMLDQVMKLTFMIHLSSEFEPERNGCNSFHAVVFGF